MDSTSFSSSTVKTWDLRRKTKQPNYKEPKETDINATGGSSKKITTKVKPRELFPVEILEEDSSTGRFKVHYVGYSASHDEWKEKNDIVSLCDEVDGDDSPEPELAGNSGVERFTLYNELATRIKQALNSSRKESPVIRIDMAFDKIEFDGGLRLCGTEKRCVRGVKRYRITKYQDLNHLLGINWHYRGLNHNGDFCYVLLDTVEFYLYRRRPLKEYEPKTLALTCRNIGHMLVFCFVKGNGVPAQFGTNKDIFVS